MTKEGTFVTLWLLIFFLSALTLYPLYKGVKHLEDIKVHIEAVIEKDSK